MARKQRSRPGPGTMLQWWLSSEDGTAKLTPQPELQFQASPSPGRDVIQINDATTYQQVLGLDSSLEHSTCYNLSRLPEARRDKVIDSLVHPERGIGMNLMRLCIGTSDFAPGPFYAYNDLTAGQEDPKQERFSIERDREHVLPVIKTAQRLNPNLKFFASPWTPLPWMKSNGLGAALSLDGTHVIPHLQSTEMRYRKAPDFSLGARVEVFLRNTTAEAITIPASTEIRLRGRTPEELLKSDDWAWHDLPSAWGGELLRLPPGAITVRS